MSIASSIAPLEQDYPAPALPILCSLAGFMIGAQLGAQKAAIQYRAQNHHVPKTTKQWYLYHRTKQSVALVGGVKSGIQYASKFGAILMVWEGARWAIQRHINVCKKIPTPNERSTPPTALQTTQLIERSLSELNQGVTSKIVNLLYGKNMETMPILDRMWEPDSRAIAQRYTQAIRSLPRWSEGIIAGSGGGIISAAAVSLFSCKLNIRIYIMDDRKIS